MNETTTIYVVSDTHGKLAPSVVRQMQGADHLVHAGDIDSGQVVSLLKMIAPLTIVRGNMDNRQPTRALPKTAMVEVAGCTIYVLHNLNELDLVPEAAGIDVVVHGHTHLPEIRHSRGVLYLNPGSASLPKRGQRPSVARLTLRDGSVDASIVYID